MRGLETTKTTMATRTSQICMLNNETQQFCTLRFLERAFPFSHITHSFSLIPRHEMNCLVVLAVWTMRALDDIIKFLFFSKLFKPI